MLVLIEWGISFDLVDDSNRDFFHQKITSVPLGKNKTKNKNQEKKPKNFVQPKKQNPRILNNSKDKDSESRNKRIRSVLGEALCQKVLLQTQKLSKFFKDF